MAATTPSNRIVGSSNTLPALPPDETAHRRRSLIRSRGLTLDPTTGPQIDYDDWQALGHDLVQLTHTIQWALGDWLRYGFWRYGHKYEEAITVTGLDYGTVANYKSVAERFQFSRRRENLSFSHHALVATLDTHQQDDWLDLATSNEWSYKELQQRLKDARPQIPGSPLPATVYRITPTPEQHTILQTLAAERGQEIPTLILTLALERLNDLQAAA